MSSNPETLSLTQCKGEKIGDGCNGDFPRKDFEGLCARCQMLEHLADDPLEYEIREAYPQCMDCGAAARHFKGEQCGRCRRLEREATGQQDDVLIAADRAFGQDFQQKMRAGKEKKKALAAQQAPAWANPVPVIATSWKTISSGDPSLPLTTSNLNQLRNAAKGKLGRMITVNVLPTINGAVAIWLPRVSDSFLADTGVMDIIDTILVNVNQTWELNSASGLTSRDVFLFWHKHQNLLPNSLHSTIGELYDAHKQDYNSQLYLENVPQQWRRLKGEFVCFDLDIDVIHFESRTKTSAPPAAFKAKRSATDGTSSEEHPMKRMRTSVNSTVTVRSSTVATVSKKVVLPSHGRDAEARTRVSLHVASVVVGALDGQVAIDWDTNDKREAIIDDIPCAAGKTKRVHRLMIGGKAYVAKRFFEIGNGRDIVSLEENSAQLANEMTRLARGQWFLDRFYERAEETGTQVASDFVFADGLLVQEIIGDCSLIPSPASTVSMDMFLEATSAHPDSAITWLLEPLRASALDRWSGTLEHPLHSDKAGMTMDAFMHYSYVYSQKSFIFADLQSTRARAPSGNAVSVLFDVMTHTIPQDSGVGDHGAAGIDSILNGHTCNIMCEALELGEENVKRRTSHEPPAASSRGKANKGGKKTLVQPDSGSDV
ncbi:kinase-like domain-containing protein [Mycena filopes]|nr:kinase-like domain-containing protein [Mycena filopes]